MAVLYCGSSPWLVDQQGPSMWTSGQDVSSTTQLRTGVPLGSVLGPILVTSFISPIQYVTSQFTVDQQQYADDNQVNILLIKR